MRLFTESQVTKGLKILAAAERDLGPLTFGQTVDLMADHFTWEPLETCRAIARALFANIGRVQP